MKWSRNKLLDILLFFESSPSGKEYHIYCALYTNFCTKRQRLFRFPDCCTMQRFTSVAVANNKKAVVLATQWAGIYVDAVDPANQWTGR
jgi:hypothetical protein